MVRVATATRYAEGDVVFGTIGWQDYAVADEGERRDARSVPDGHRPHGRARACSGSPGMTAYFGLIDVGEPKEGDTVVVSGAAGATGSVVGQIARIKGAAKVVGIAGGRREVRLAHRRARLRRGDRLQAPSNVGAALSASCAPTGIDVFFDNVGGEILDALPRAAWRCTAGSCCCGAIATYNDSERPTGPRTT